MALARKVSIGTPVRYRTAAGKLKHGVCTAVTSQTVISLRVGGAHTGTVFSSVSKGNRHTTGAAWYAAS